MEEIEAIEEMDQVKVLLDRWQEGDSQAMGELLSFVYSELRRIARGYLDKEEDDHTMVSGDLVHEAFLRLAQGPYPQLTSRRQLLAVQAKTMRRILVEHARKQKASKRIGRRDRINLDQVPELGVGSGLKVIEIHEAIEALKKRHPRPAELIELRFFGGLKTSECAKALGVSKATVTRDWFNARLWLRLQLSPPMGLQRNSLLSSDGVSSTRI